MDFTYTSRVTRVPGWNSLLYKILFTKTRRRRLIHTHLNRSILQLLHLNTDDKTHDIKVTEYF